MAEAAPNQPGSMVVLCPRCGYDLRGQLLGRGEAESGTCSECGLSFQWRDVTDPLRIGPTWCIEYEPSWRRLPLAALKTWLHMLWPWGFWSRLQMHHEPRWRRIGLMYLLALVPFVVLYVVFQTSVAVYVRFESDRRYEDFRLRVPGYIARYSATLNSPKPKELDPQQWQNQVAFLQRRIAELQPWTTSTRPWSIDGSYFEIACRAVFTPTSTEPMATITFSSNVLATPFASPRTMHAEVEGMVRTRGMYQWARWTPDIAAALLIVPTGSMMVFPLTLALLPSSRRHARIRWRHIWRITAYSGMIPLLAAWITGAVIATGLFTPALDRFVSNTLPTFVVLVPLALLIVWWGVALRRFTRLRHSWGVAVVNSLLAALVAGGALWYLILFRA